LKKKDKKELFIVNDLEEKIIELSLQLKQKNNEVDHLTDSNYTFFSKLAHNLKNPIGSVYSFSELLLENPKDWSQEKLHKYLEIMYDSAKYSISLLNSSSKYYALFSNKLSLVLERVSIVELLNEVIHKIERENTTKILNFNKKFPKKDIVLTVDKNELKLALYNLVKNAVQYSKPDYKINITVEKSEEVSIKIQDFGTGITNENLKEVFKPFFVVDTYTKNKEKCTGLGLPIAKRIIELHNGAILISSELKQGTTAEIKLPLNN
jgi:signal transduction histidine kinase